jgi:hypothetical protein
MTFRLLVVLTLLGFLTPSQGDEFTDLANRVCDKLRTCSRQQMDKQQGVTPPMRLMMEQFVNQACASLRQQYHPAMRQHSLYGQSLNCMKSMVKMDCAELSQGNKTAACQALESMADGQD